MVRRYALGYESPRLANDDWTGAMRANDLSVVRNLTIFDGLSDDVLEALTCGALLKWFPRETVLFKEGDSPDLLHVLAEGSAMLSGRDEAGQETVIDILKPGGCFVPAAVLTDTPYLMSAKTMESSHLLLLPSPIVRKLVAQEPTFAGKILNALAGQFCGLVGDIKNLKLRTTTQRLISFILTEVDPVADGATFELSVSKRVLASRLGMTPEQLSRTFAKLSQHDLHIRGSTIQIRSIERLLQY